MRELTVKEQEMIDSLNDSETLHDYEFFMCEEHGLYSVPLKQESSLCPKCKKTGKVYILDMKYYGDVSEI